MVHTGYRFQHALQASGDGHITGLFEASERIETHGVASKPVPAEFGVEGFYFRYKRHFVHWRRLSNGDIGIVTILHKRTHQIEPFREHRSGEPGAC